MNREIWKEVLERIEAAEKNKDQLQRVWPPRDAIEHEVKSWCYLYSAAILGVKKHDFRDITERNYRIGDRLKFREFDQTKGEYTGREALFEITYITSNETPCAMSSCALDKRYGVLSIKFLRELK